ncbi:MAG TPA: preprotein translocase subunit YajC [bacterium]|nr:preprotein translocase subunit YajC [bacterium]HNT66686.1 preprotein translocase subunit YajC [bacterium]HOX87021.1 preprotein translocase subunit YajC [bacterium]HPG46352.1 preprotein translocase subunit YajC [bacterium]HPM98734.1 preprotein translocase subunit YajC [bacterium]
MIPVLLLMDVTASGQSGTGGGMAGMLLPMLLIFVIMYFLIIRPQSKRQKEHRVMQDSLNRGDKIMTAGGVLGTIEGVKEKDNILILKIADNVKIRIARSAIARKLTDEEAKSIS